ncbi:MAG: iron transporter [Pseudomonadota bacterium]
MQRTRKSTKPTLTAAYRWHVAARGLLAFFGGFALVSAVGALLATLFERSGLMPQAQAVHVMTLVGYLGWCGVAMWVFWHPRLGRLTGIVVGSTAICLMTNVGLRAL